MVKMIFNVDERCNLANEVIRRIAESQTIQTFVLESDFEDKAIANGEICGKFRTNFAGLMEWLSVDLELIRYVGDRKGLVTLSDEGRYLYDSNLTVKEYIEHKDKKRAEVDATIAQNLNNAKLNGIYTIVKTVGVILNSILIPLIGFFAGDIVRTITIAICSFIFGTLWSTDIGRAIKPFINYFVKD